MSEARNGEFEAALTAQKLDTIMADMSDLKSAIKDLTSAVTRLAVVEERVASATDSLRRAFKEIERHDGRIKVLETAQPMQQQSSTMVNDVVKLVVVAVLTALLSLVVIRPAKGAQAAIEIVSK